MSSVNMNTIDSFTTTDLHSMTTGEFMGVFDACVAADGQEKADALYAEFSAGIDRVREAMPVWKDVVKGITPTASLREKLLQAIGRGGRVTEMGIAWNGPQQSMLADLQSRVDAIRRG